MTAVLAHGQGGVHTTIRSAHWGSMDLFEGSTYSFVIKVWLEQKASSNGRAIWRGHITHIPSGERRYLRSVRDISVFVMFYLDKMGVRLGPRWWLEKWWHRLRL